MTPIPIQHLSYRFEFPAQEEPDWKNVIERWYQLDAFAYGLTQAYTVWKSRLDSMGSKAAAKPARIFLASPQASNETDLQFARGGATSPAKFVHTLANIRSSPLCQVMEWSGPVICLQKDPFTQVHALREAAAFVEWGGAVPVWMLSVFKTDSGYEAQVFVLGHDSTPSDLVILRESSENLDKKTEKPPLQTDRELQEWLGSNANKDGFPLPGGFELRKSIR